MKSSAFIYCSSQAYSRAKLTNEILELGQALLVALTYTVAENRWYRGKQVFCETACLQSYGLTFDMKTFEESLLFGNARKHNLE